ncbi:MAG: phosphate ABC transporter substrate-binding protein PstS [Candidatus Improbicoccus devescovinae]|nr:MAG: phosphate ABC transporter substrate-binding protein PstS [Candidatus Improbicoccus devescovinae]
MKYKNNKFYLISYMFLVIFGMFVLMSASIKNRLIFPVAKNATQEYKYVTHISSGGSTSMSRLLNILGEEFNNYYPEFIFEKFETGSGAAVNEVLNGGYDLGDISRNLSESEKSDILDENIIAFDGISVIVNKNNPVYNLSSENILDIFNKKITTWSDISGINANITLVGREESSGTREGFEDAILNKTLVYDIEFPESGDVLSRVASDPNAIGYVSFSSVSEGVRSVSVDGIPCNLNSISKGMYKFYRPFIQIYLKNKHNYVLNKWFEFIKSEIGQEIIKKEKFVGNVNFHDEASV